MAKRGVSAGCASVVGRAGEEVGGLARGERGVLREHGGDRAGDDGRAGGGAIDGHALAVEPRGLHAVAGRGELELRAELENETCCSARSMAPTETTRGSAAGQASWAA